MVRLSSILSACAVVALLVTTSEAADHFLTVGGGPIAKSSQISLEKNVQYFQRTLTRLGLDKHEHLILFGDGDNPQPDLQYEDVDRDAEDVRTLLAETIGPNSGIRFNYRNFEIDGVSGAAEPEVIEKTLEDLAQRLNKDDRLIFYFTGHGGKGKPETEVRVKKEKEDDADKKESDKKDEEKSDADKKEDGDKKKDDKKEEKPKKREKPLVDNITHLWNSNKMQVTDWTEKLDELPADMPVIAVMVQCYSGGFGNMIFKGGDPENGLAEHARCGFFSTVPDRVAAGCTPNVEEAEYREYSSYFWEALTGETRTGKSADKPDYDADGQCSLLEAHAYTVLNADTIDIPTRTSDALLRYYSATEGKDGLLSTHSPIAALLATASPCEQEVIKGLSDRFELTGADRGKQVEEAIKRLQDEKKKIDGDIRGKRGEQMKSKIEVAKMLQVRWPSLGNAWHPEAARLVTEEADVVKQAILESEDYVKFKELDAEMEELKEKGEKLNLDIVKLERLKYWLETRALAINLPIMADEKVQKAYAELIELESQQLVTTPPAVADNT